jgi:hypothetical protein
MKVKENETLYTPPGVGEHLKPGEFQLPKYPNWIGRNSI